MAGPGVTSLYYLPLELPPEQVLRERQADEDIEKEKNETHIRAHKEIFFFYNADTWFAKMTHFESSHRIQNQYNNTGATTSSTRRSLRCTS